jgi:hypothetical protein
MAHRVCRAAAEMDRHGQSLNLYMAEPSGKKLHDMYISPGRRA